MSSNKRVEIRTPTAGLVASAETTPKEVGLAAPGGLSRSTSAQAKPLPQAQLAFWTSSVGFKLVVLKYESDDTMEKVTSFYRNALAKYGRVLQCPGADGSEKRERSKELDCDQDNPKNGEIELKAGTDEKQRVVAVEPKPTGTNFALICIETRGSEDRK